MEEWHDLISFEKHPPAAVWRMDCGDRDGGKGDPREVTPVIQMRGPGGLGQNNNSVF